MEITEIPLPEVKYLKEEDYFVNSCKSSIDCSYLLEALYYESRGESDKGVAAVAYVILNRVKHPTLWPNTIVGVITQKSQFSYRFDGSLEKGFTDKKQYRRIAVIAKKVLDGEISSPVGDSTHYHTKQVKPVWREKLTKIGSVGRHIFYK